MIVSKIPLEDVQYIPFTLPTSLWNISFMRHIIKNGMLLARLKDTQLTIISTHTFTDFEFDWSPTNKFYGFVKVQNEQLVKQIKKLSNQGQSIILTGDLNSKKNSRIYKYVLSETKMKDVFANASFPTYYNDRLNYKFKGKTSERIDFIFVLENKQKIKALTTEHLFTQQETLANGKKSYLSDHLGLKTAFELSS